MIGLLRNRVWPVARQTLGQWVEDDSMTLAAAVSYYAAFSFFPLVAVLLSLLGLLVHISPRAQDSQQFILEWVAQSTSPQMAGEVQKIFAEVESKAAIGGPLALLTLLIGAIGVFSQLDYSFDRIWKVESPPHMGFVKTIVRVLSYRLKAFLMLLALGVLMVASFATGMALSTISRFATNFSGELGGDFVQHLIIMLVNAVIFTIMYKTLPRVTVWWRDASRGGLFVAIVWELGRQALSLYVIGPTSTAYGVIGAFIAVMAWIYYASIVLFMGAELVHTLGARREERRRALPQDPRD